MMTALIVLGALLYVPVGLLTLWLMERIVGEECGEDMNRFGIVVFWPLVLVIIVALLPFMYAFHYINKRIDLEKIRKYVRGF